MANFHLQFVTPERTILQTDCTKLICPTQEGQITILPGHADLVANVVSGELLAFNNKESFAIHVAGGFIQIKNAGTEVNILADGAEHSHEIDLKRAEEAKLQAEKSLAEQTLSDEEYATVMFNLTKNLNRINIARKHVNRKNPITGGGVFHE